MFKYFKISVLLASTMALTGCFEQIFGGCKIDNVDVQPDIFFINGQADAGFRVGVLTERTGRDGELDFEVTLSSTEGDVVKTRSIFMKEGQRGTVQFQFHEPTINAQQVTAHATCTPA